MPLSRWRPVGESGPYPEWFRGIAFRSGAYAIRDIDTREVWYVGESHTNRLGKTIQRHLQRWQGPTAGTTYQRGAVEIAVSITAPADAEEEQARLIQRLDPIDNTYLVEEKEEEEEDDVPF